MYVLKYIRIHRYTKGFISAQCLTCTFRASCCSARLSRAQVMTFADFSVWDRKKKGGGDDDGGARPPALPGTRSTSSPTGIGIRRMVV